MTSWSRAGFVVDGVHVLHVHMYLYVWLTSASPRPGGWALWRFHALHPSDVRALAWLATESTRHNKTRPVTTRHDPTRYTTLRYARHARLRYETRRYDTDIRVRKSFLYRRVVSHGPGRTCCGIIPEKKKKRKNPAKIPLSLGVPAGVLAPKSQDKSRADPDQTAATD